MRYQFRMFKAKWLTALLLIFCAFHQLAVAQQDPMYSQYMFNTLIINPAYAGSRDVLSATALHRRQWLNIDGAPVTTTLSIDAPLRNEKVGLGLTIINDNIGVTKKTGVFGNYAYRIRISGAGTLALGLSAGVSQFRANLSEIKTSNDGGVADPAFSQNVVRWLPNFGGGIYYSTDKVYVGLSIPQFVNNKLVNDFASLTGNSHARQFRHLFFAFGGIVGLSNHIKIRPSLLYKYVNAAPMQFDLNCNVWFYDVLALGATYRTSNTIVGLIELQATKQFRVGYAYDTNLTGITTNNSGTHEIMLRYEFAFNKKKFLTPRYF